MCAQQRSPIKSPVSCFTQKERPTVMRAVPLTRSTHRPYPTQGVASRLSRRSCRRISFPCTSRILPQNLVAKRAQNIQFDLVTVSPESSGCKSGFESHGLRPSTGFSLEARGSRRNTIGRLAIVTRESRLRPVHFVTKITVGTLSFAQPSRESSVLGQTGVGCNMAEASDQQRRPLRTRLFLTQT